MENGNNSRARIGFALCGSFCTLKKMTDQLERLAEIGYDLTPIMSENTYTTDTRFGKAEEFVQRVENICGKPVLHRISEVEPIGPKKLLDLLVIAPCTGNTLAKLANGISDSAVSLAAKAHLRNERPVLVAVSSNDALSGNARNLGTLMNTKNYFFVPFGQDDAVKKPTSLVAKTEMIPEAVKAALEGRQIQPILI
ncbi:MAG: dipicolinate synthase subunit B [Clostridiales bacterium]|nr:dipicolinate synthase subunit B [Clostridiales bacterium]MDD6342182.1 dipicolinate synthase subunit B [Eubacteriales bacterium]MDD7394198.1 dipicolinate synthase subunit B [Eubacteriales bacterium]